MAAALLARRLHEVGVASDVNSVGLLEGARDDRVLEHGGRRSMARLRLRAIPHASGLAAVLEATPHTVLLVSLDAHPQEQVVVE